MDDPLRQAADLIRAGDKAAALALLRPLCDDSPGSAQAWWLLSQALDDPAEVRRALRQALRADPYHSQAADCLQQLTGTPLPGSRTVTIPGGDLSVRDLAAESTIVHVIGDDGELAAPVSAPRPRARKKKPGQGWRALLAAGLAVGLTMGLLMVMIRRPSSPTPEPLPPADTVGPYYASLLDENSFLSYCDYCYAPARTCGRWRAVVGRVDGGGVFSVRAWTPSDSIDVGLLTENEQGGFHITIDTELLKPPDYLPTTGFTMALRLYDRAGRPQAGITDIHFDDSTCTAYIVYQYDASVGIQAVRPAPVGPWGGPYRLSYSTPTNAGFLTANLPALEIYRACGWTGVIGIAYDGSGPVDGLTVQAWAVGERGQLHTAITGDNPEVGGGGWVMPLERGKRYIFNVINPHWGSAGTQVIDFPADTDCNTRIIRAAITYNAAP